jgi:hypothetical protein
LGGELFKISTNGLYTISSNHANIILTEGVIYITIDRKQIIELLKPHLPNANNENNRLADDIIFVIHANVIKQS